ncbi:MAG: bifunctional phosphopantothenoylcysteine decarboxylase/phosphopantothenate--cysteine ligase CoaBC [Actinomycetota bacterium]|nr:bifunctional phosphopantothenoylcysteine decarboxylase/phosphopantothenate--cysteine ligase CoaBC [Actinomycetota bacterium]
MKATTAAPPNVVLGVCGGIAAYKAVDVCRRLVDTGAHVVPVLTDDATRFVGTVTFSALASEPAQVSLWDAHDPIPHVRLGRDADVVVVAPATARLLGAYVGGLATDLLTATLLATRAPVVICPAMHTEMWEHPAVRHNVAVLRERGVCVVEPAVGRLAGGDEGAGRLAETADIVAAVGAALALSDPNGRRVEADLAGRRVLVTAGGTREPIDAVRFIGNRSSGKQGHAVAAQAAARGAFVTLVTASDRPTPAGVEVVPVSTAAQMERAVMARSADADVVIMAAAVADFRPRQASSAKLSKADGVPVLALEATPDILAGLGRARPAGQVLVGFAAETGDVADRARAKLVAKGLDIVVGNDISAPDAGFDRDTNRAVIVEADGTTTDVPLVDKAVLASAVLDVVLRHLDTGTESDQSTGLRASTRRSTS